MMGARRRLFGAAFLLVAFATLARNGVADEKKSPVTGVDRPKVLYLRTELTPYTDANPTDIANLLNRELVRQAFFIAAMERVDVPIYDESLFESLPADSSSVHVAVTERNGWKKNLYVVTIPVDPQVTPRELVLNAETKPLWTKMLDYTTDADNFHTEVSVLLTSGVLDEGVEFLRQQGIEVREKKRELVAASALLKERLSKWNEELLKIDPLAQFAVVREAHSFLQSEGPSPEVLSVLVRGYANLSVLTQHQWNAIGEVFAARAMLYAQTLVRLTETSTESLWVRAYAWALLGIHNQAIADIDEIAKRGETTVGADEASTAIGPWTRLIEPYVHCDREAVKQLEQADPALASWALRLRFQLSAAFRHPSWIREDGMPLLAAPCFGVFAEMSQNGFTRESVQAGSIGGIVAFGSQVPVSLANLDRLPEPILALVESDDATSEISPLPTRVALALREYSQTQRSPGLSWSVLATVLEEEQFVQAANYLEGTSDAVEFPLDDVIDEFLEVMGDHRYSRLLESYRFRPHLQVAELEALLKDVSVHDSKPAMFKLAKRLWYIRNAAGETFGTLLWQKAYQNRTYQGLVNRFFVEEPVFKDGVPSYGEVVANSFRTIAPHSNLVPRIAVNTVQNPDLDKLLALEKQIDRDPFAYDMLGFKFEALGDSEGAIRCYEKALELLPLHGTAMRLAANYWKQRNLNKYDETLLKALTYENHGLDNATVHRELAHAYMRRGDWSKAKQHGVQAAESGSAWGLAAAAFATEGLAQWDESEAWHRARSEAYFSTSGTCWYLYCQRTGRGDLEGARRFASVYFNSSGPQANDEYDVLKAVYYLLEGQPNRARDVLEVSLARNANFSRTLLAVHAHRLLDDEQAAQQAITRIERKSPPGPAEHTGLQVARAVLEVAKNRTITDEQLAQIKSLFASLSIDDGFSRSCYAFLLGNELDRMNRKEDAVEFWRMSLATADGDEKYTTLAGARLTERFVVSRPDDQPLGVPKIKVDDAKDSE